MPFSYGVLADSLAEKGILYAQIQVNDQVLHLMTTHLQASYFDSTEFHWNIAFKTRCDQLKEVNAITKLLLDTYTEPGKVLLIGDFNVDAQRYKNKTPVLYNK